MISDNRPPDAWPSKGVIAVKDIVVRYRDELEPVLKGITFTTERHEKASAIQTLLISFSILVKTCLLHHAECANCDMLCTRSELLAEQVHNVVDYCRRECGCSGSSCYAMQGHNYYLSWWTTIIEMTAYWAMRFSCMISFCPCRMRKVYPHDDSLPHRGTHQVRFTSHV